MSFKATDYLITPRDVWVLFKALFGLSFFGWVKLVLLIGAFFLARHYGADVVDAFFCAYLVGVFAYDMDARISISGALGLLVLIMVIMVVGPYTEFVNETTWPEPIAVWVYYLLAIGVMKQIKDTYISRDCEDGSGEEEGNDEKKTQEPTNREDGFTLRLAPRDSGDSSDAAPVIPEHHDLPVGPRVVVVPHPKYHIMKRGKTISVTQKYPAHGSSQRALSAAAPVRRRSGVVEHHHKKDK